MALKVYQVTLSGVTQVTTTNVPFQELRCNPAAADYYIGGPDVSTTKYFAKVTAAGSGVIIANGPAAIAVDTLKNLYLVGTDTNVVNLGVITL